MRIGEVKRVEDQRSTLEAVSKIGVVRPEIERPVRILEPLTGSF
jgi:hypothetical protein